MLTQHDNRDDNNAGDRDNVSNNSDKFIHRDKNGFVQCLDSSLKNSSDSMTQLFGSFFDPAMVTQAYEGLCTNITGKV